MAYPYGLLMPSLMGQPQSMQIDPMMGGVIGGAPQSAGLFPEAPSPQAPSAAFQPQPAQSGGGILENLFGGGAGGGAGSGGAEPDYALMALAQGIANKDVAGAMSQFAPLMASSRQTKSTRDWLVKKGMAPDDADIVAYNPELMKHYLKPGEPDEYQKRAKAALEFGLDPKSPEGRMYTLTGKMPGDGAGATPSSIQEYEYGEKNPAYKEFMKTNKGRDSALTSTDKKAIFEAEDAIPVLDNTIGALTRAKELNDKTYTGYTAGARGWAGSNLPGASAVFDEDTAKNTLEFNNLMSMESIKAMADTLKGATTDFELRKFVEVLGDPATPPEVRVRTIDRMIQLAERKKQIAEERVRGLKGGDYYDAPSGGMSNGAAPGGTTSGGVQWSIEP